MLFVGFSLCRFVLLIPRGSIRISDRGKCISTQRLVLVWLVLLCHQLVYRLFVNSYDLVLQLLFLTQRTEPLSRIGTRGKKQRKLMGSSAENSSGVHWCRRRVMFNEAPEKVREKTGFRRRFRRRFPRFFSLWIGR